MDNIFDQIRKDHREAEDIMSRLSQAYDSALFDKLSALLIAHMQAEEQTLYPALRDYNSQMVQESMEEHNHARMALDQANRNREGQSLLTLQSNLSNLSRLVLAHVQKEESLVLPAAQSTFDQNQIDDLSRRFEEIDNRMVQQRVR